MKRTVIAAALGAGIAIVAGAGFFLFGGKLGGREHHRSSVQQILNAPNSIAARQKLKVDFQTGRTGTPQSGPALSTTRPSTRGKALEGRSTVAAVIDQVPLSAKSLVTIRYGATVYQSHVGPIEVGATYLLPYAENVVFGADAFPMPLNASGFAVTFGSAAPPFGVLIKRRGAPPMAWLAGIDETSFRGTVTSGVLGLSQADPLLTADAAGTMTIAAIKPSASGEFYFDLPDQSRFGIESFYLVLSTKLNKPIAINYAGLLNSEKPSKLVVVKSIGDETDGRPILELTDDKGVVVQVHPDLDGQFVFERPEGNLFAAAIHTDNGVHYFSAGRWLSPIQALDSTVLLAPDYMNAGGELNDLARWQASLRRSQVQSYYTSTYAPHTRGWWSGAANKMTRFRADYFYNNLGFHDIDALWSEGDQCLTGFYLGESLVEGRQMRIEDRALTILSEKLSLKMRRCVIIHSVAAGKSIQSYEDILRLRYDYDPDILMFEISPAIFSYLTPMMQKHYFGYGEGHSPVGAFDLNESNNLVYLPPAQDWIEHTVSPNMILPSGADLNTAFFFDQESASPEANHSWSMLEALVKQYRSEFPDTMLVLDANYTRALCHSQENCQQRPVRSVTKNAEVVVGPATFDKRLSDLCYRAAIVCSFPDPVQFESVFLRPMIYENDFHYNRFGNQWLANELAQDMAQPLTALAGK